MDTTQAPHTRLWHVLLFSEGHHTVSNRNICKHLVSKCDARPAVPCTAALLLCLSRMFKPFPSVYHHLSHVLTDRSWRKIVHLTTFSQTKGGKKVLCKSYEEESMSVSILCCFLTWYPLWDHREKKKSFDGSKCLLVLWCFLPNEIKAIKLEL